MRDIKSFVNRTLFGIYFGLMLAYTADGGILLLSIGIGTIFGFALYDLLEKQSWR